MEPSAVNPNEIKVRRGAEWVKTLRDLALDIGPAAAALSWIAGVIELGAKHAKVFLAEVARLGQTAPPPAGEDA